MKNLTIEQARFVFKSRVDTHKPSEIKRGSDAFDLLVDEAIERVYEDADPGAEDFDAYFQEYVEDALDALCRERNVTLVSVRRFI